MERYSELVMDHFNNPRNVGTIPDADGIGLTLNPVCGDMMKLSIRIRDGIIVDAKFQTQGCAAAIATSSVCTEVIKGKAITAVEGLTREDFAAAVGGLPPSKVHCSVLAAEALRKALADYRQRRNQAAPVA